MAGAPPAEYSKAGKNGKKGTVSTWSSEMLDDIRTISPHKTFRPSRCCAAQGIADITRITTATSPEHVRHFLLMGEGNM